MTFTVGNNYRLRGGWTAKLEAIGQTGQRHRDKARHTPQFGDKAVVLIFRIINTQHGRMVVTMGDGIYVPYQETQYDVIGVA